VGRKLVRIYTVPPRAYFPPGYPLREATRTFCRNFVQRGLKLQGRPDWQSRAGSLLAAEICGRGYDLLTQTGKLPPGQPRLIPERRRGQWIDLDTGRIIDQPVPEAPWPFPGPRQPGYEPIPQVPLKFVSQSLVPSPRQQGLVPQGQQRPIPERQVPRGTNGQPPTLPFPQTPNIPPAGQEPSPVPWWQSFPSPRSQAPLPGPGSQPMPDVPTQPPIFPGPRQAPSPVPPGQPPGAPGPDASGDIPTVSIPIPRPPRVKPGDTDIIPRSPVPGLGIALTPESPTFYYDVFERLVNFIAGFFGQTAIKAQKVGIQDFWTPIFRHYSRELSLPLRDNHALQFDPEGVRRYTLNDPLYSRLRTQFLSEVGPLARYISRNPGPGLTERIVNQFVTNAAINKWSEEQTVNLWKGVLQGLPERR